MATKTLSKDDILEAIGNMSVTELADLVEEFKDALYTDVEQGPARLEFERRRLMARIATTAAEARRNAAVRQTCPAVPETANTSSSGQCSSDMGRQFGRAREPANKPTMNTHQKAMVMVLSRLPRRRSSRAVKAYATIPTSPIAAP